MQPNVSEYSLTLPYFVCVQWGTQCVAGCGNDSGCASACRQDHPCGAQDPKRYNTTTSSSSPATATGSSSTGVFTGLAGQSPHSKGSYAPAVAEVGRATVLMVVLGSLFAGFAVML